MTSLYALLSPHIQKRRAVLSILVPLCRIPPCYPPLSRHIIPQDWCTNPLLVVIPPLSPVVGTKIGGIKLIDKTFSRTIENSIINDVIISVIQKAGFDLAWRKSQEGAQPRCLRGKVEVIDKCWVESAKANTQNKESERKLGHEVVEEGFH